MFLGFTVLAFFVPESWSLAALMGIMFVVESILYSTQKDIYLVIDDKGIHEGKKLDYKWFQIDHCYFEGRVKGTFTRPLRYPYLVIVLKSGKKVPVDLSSYKFKSKDLLKSIDEASGKNLHYKSDSDSQYEKAVRKKEYKSEVIGAIIGLIIFFVWLLSSMAAR